MGRAKRAHAIAARTLPNCFTDLDGLSARLGTRKPITLELACGKGEYTLALARRFPTRLFVGVDAKADRLYTPARSALAERLTNAFFLELEVERLTDLGGRRVEEIWIPFPDPHPKPRQADKRLTAPHLLVLYRRLLQPGGVVHLKTDHPALYSYTLQRLSAFGCRLLHSTTHLQSGWTDSHPLGICTAFERNARANGAKIMYLSFAFRESD